MTPHPKTCPQESAPTETLTAKPAAKRKPPLHPCPRCGAKMANSKVRRDEKYVLRYQQCAACNYSQWAKFLPEVLIECTPVGKRTRSLLSVPKSDPISAPAALSALEQ
jgi:formate dehydrogenase maturation protein FdhE